MPWMVLQDLYTDNLCRPKRPDALTAVGLLIGKLHNLRNYDNSASFGSKNPEGEGEMTIPAWSITAKFLNESLSPISPGARFYNSIGSSGRLQLRSVWFQVYSG